MNFCHNCGTHIEQNPRYCPNCGTDFRAAVLENNFDTALNINKDKKAIRTMNIASICLMLPYVVLALVISLFADFYTSRDRVDYILGLAWPVFFLLVLFILVRHIEQCGFIKKRIINTHLILSIMFVGVLVLGGIIMLLLSYGLVIFPFISSILQVLIAFKIKKNFEIA